MNKKSYVVLGAFFVGILSLSLFSNFDRIRQEAASLKAVQLEEEAKLQVDTTKKLPTTLLAAPVNERVVLTGGVSLGSGIKAVSVVSTPTVITPTTWSIATTTPGWLRRSEHASVSFLNEAWVLGGLTFNGTGGIGVWSSIDGTNWTQKTASAPWETVGLGIGRFEHASVVFRNEMWVFGGLMKTPTGFAYMNDIWRSSDGINWSQVIPNQSFGIRGNHGAVVFNNEIFIMGTAPYPGTQTTSEVWSSPDGVNWTRRTTNAAFGMRYDFGLIEFNGSLWLMGGMQKIAGNSFRMNDVWNSTDGFTWTQVTTVGPMWSPRTKLSAFVFDNKMWITSGEASNTTQATDMWSSKDGITWTLEQSIIPGIGYQDHAVAVIPVPELPDLVVSDLEWSDTLVNPHYGHTMLTTALGKPAYLRVTVKNKGPGPFTAPANTIYKLYVKYQMPASVVGTITIPAGTVIPANGTKQYTFTEAYAPGRTSYIIGSKKSSGIVEVISEIDTAFAVPEIMETNNTANVNIPVSGY